MYAGMLRSGAFASSDGCAAAVDAIAAIAMARMQTWLDMHDGTPARARRFEPAGVQVRKRCVSDRSGKDILSLSRSNRSRDNARCRPHGMQKSAASNTQFPQRHQRARTNASAAPSKATGPGAARIARGFARNKEKVP